MAENIHDKFFKENFSRRDIAISFVQESFPTPLLESLDLSTFESTNNSYVDTELEQYFADLVYSCRLKEAG